jgi:hypothetical protein
MPMLILEIGLCAEMVRSAMVTDYTTERKVKRRMVALKHCFL